MKRKWNESFFRVVVFLYLYCIGFSSGEGGKDWPDGSDQNLLKKGKAIVESKASPVPMTVGGGKVETVVLEAVPGEVRGKGVGKIVVIRWTIIP